MGTEKTKTATYRSLSPAETRQLEQQGCTAEDWTRVEVVPDIDLRHVAHVHFSGTNRIGAFRKTVTLPGGVACHTGIRHATLHDTTVGDDCLIEHIHGYIAHYDIGTGCVLLRTDTLAMTGPSAFGNGTELSVMSESGGREIVMHDRLSAQEAYLQAMYRHDGTFIHNLRTMALDYAAQQTSTRGTVGDGAQIVRCGVIYNVRIGACSRLEGVTRLENGTINSLVDAPTVVGEGVIARDFILQSGCHITDGAMLTRCHVGQASAIGHGFSATDVYFACNCQAEHGEACAIWAGPYTVTHHKSTLLIGGMFSFMNAGSGTNQSNHAYKLGPRHHGVLERGCKTASGSHIAWPARVGAFSMVMGHCLPGTDSSEWPFPTSWNRARRTTSSPASPCAAWARCATSGNGLHAMAVPRKSLGWTRFPTRLSPPTRWGGCGRPYKPWRGWPDAIPKKSGKWNGTGCGSKGKPCGRDWSGIVWP